MTAAMARVPEGRFTREELASALAETSAVLGLDPRGAKLVRFTNNAVYALATTATGVWSPPGRVRLPGLDPHAVYRVVPLAPGDESQGPARQAVPWWNSGVRLSGRALAVAGLQAPVLFPERLVLVRATRH